MGLVVGGLLIYALGLALNSRRIPDGTRVRTNRHGLGDGVAVERFGRGQAVLGILALPLSTVQFVSAPIVWTLTIAGPSSWSPRWCSCRDAERLPGDAASMTGSCPTTDTLVLRYAG